MRWTFAHASALGLDPARIGVAGDSAGGQICVATALRLAASSDGPNPLVPSSSWSRMMSGLWASRRSVTGAQSRRGSERRRQKRHHGRRGSSIILTLNETIVNSVRASVLWTPPP